LVLLLLLLLVLCQCRDYVNIYSANTSVCVQDYCKSNQPISLKLSIMIGSTSSKNWLTFGGDPVPEIWI